MKFEFQSFTKVVNEAFNYLKRGWITSRMRGVLSFVAVLIFIPILGWSTTKHFLKTNDGKQFILQTSKAEDKMENKPLEPQNRAISNRETDYFDLEQLIRSRGSYNYKSRKRVVYDKNMSLHCQGPLGVHGMACTRCVLCNYK